MKPKFYEMTAQGETSAEILIFEKIGQDFWGDGVSAKQFAEDLKALGDIDQLTVRINSPGGAVNDGIAIANTIKNHRANVDVFIDGYAMSIAANIAIAGDTVTMAQDAYMMIHDPMGGLQGMFNAKELREMAGQLDTVKKAMIKSFVHRTGKSEDEISEAMSNDTWFTADEAAEFGLIDAIESPQQKVAAASFDLSEFRNVPEHLLPSAAAGDPKNIKGKPMKPKNIDPGANGAEGGKDPGKTDETAVATAVAQALADDQKRRADIKAAFEPFPAHAELAQECSDDPNCTVADARELLLVKMGKGSEPVGGGSGHIEVGASNAIAGVQNAIFGRLNLEDYTSGNPYRGSSLIHLFAIATGREAEIRGRTKSEAASIILAHSTSDFPKLLANTSNKILLKAFEEFPSTFRTFCKIGQVSDFKENSRVQLGSFADLVEITEEGEYKYAKQSEEDQKISAKTKGRMIRFTRKMLIDDDLGGFNDRARQLGIAANRTLNADAYGVLTANAALTDGDALFHANHGNLAASGAAFNKTTYSAGKLAMRKQKAPGKEGRELNIMPKYWLGPIAKEDDAKEFIMSPTDNSSSNSNKPNVHRNAVEIVTDPVLDADSATAWYLLADPNLAPVVEVVFLDGVETPFTDENIDWHTDALEMKVRFDYGQGAIGFRGGYKNPGA